MLHGFMRPDHYHTTAKLLRLVTHIVLEQAALRQANFPISARRHTGNSCTTDSLPVSSASASAFKRKGNRCFRHFTGEDYETAESS
ncbi:MAG: hypothetical protein AAB403_23130, partial [Planctomycetota bacterium]